MIYERIVLPFFLSYYASTHRLICFLRYTDIFILLFYRHFTKINPSNSLQTLPLFLLDSRQIIPFYFQKYPKMSVFPLHLQTLYSSLHHIYLRHIRYTRLFISLYRALSRPAERSEAFIFMILLTS